MSARAPRAGDVAFLSYRTVEGGVRAGLVGADDVVHDLARATGRPDFAGLGAAIERWDEALPLARRAAAAPTGASRVGTLGEVALVAPLPAPGAIFCAAANYRDHMLAMARKLGLEPEPDPKSANVTPYHFVKPSRQTISGPGEPVALPGHAGNVDWEVELVAVIGRAAKDVDAADALAHVAGWTVGNDLSVRDRRHMKRPNVPDGSLFRTDFLAMKGFDGSCPTGPWIVPADAVRDPQDLRLGLDVDGETRQDSSTASMVFTVAEQIAYLSTLCTLHPGDLVLTGTPAGTGAESDTFLAAGQTVTAWVEGIGELVTPIRPAS